VSVEDVRQDTEAFIDEPPPPASEGEAPALGSYFGKQKACTEHQYCSGYWADTGSAKRRCCRAERINALSESL